MNFLLNYSRFVWKSAGGAGGAGGVDVPQKGPDMPAAPSAAPAVSEDKEAADKSKATERALQQLREDISKPQTAEDLYRKFMLDNVAMNTWYRKPETALPILEKYFAGNAAVGVLIDGLKQDKNSDAYKQSIAALEHLGAKIAERGATIQATSDKLADVSQTLAAKGVDTKVREGIDNFSNLPFGAKIATGAAMFAGFMYLKNKDPKNHLGKLVRFVLGLGLGFLGVDFLSLIGTGKSLTEHFGKWTHTDALKVSSQLPDELKRLGARANVGKDKTSEWVAMSKMAPINMDVIWSLYQKGRNERSIDPTFLGMLPREIDGKTLFRIVDTMVRDTAQLGGASGDFERLYVRHQPPYTFMQVAAIIYQRESFDTIAGEKANEYRAQLRGDLKKMFAGSPEVRAHLTRNNVSLFGIRTDARRNAQAEPPDYSFMFAKGDAGQFTTRIDMQPKERVAEVKRLRDMAFNYVKAHIPATSAFSEREIMWSEKDAVWKIKGTNLSLVENENYEFEIWSGVSRLARVDEVTPANYEEYMMKGRVMNSLASQYSVLRGQPFEFSSIKRNPSGAYEIAARVSDTPIALNYDEANEQTTLVDEKPLLHSESFMSAKREQFQKELGLAVAQDIPDAEVVFWRSSDAHHFDRFIQLITPTPENRIWRMTMAAKMHDFVSEYSSRSTTAKSLTELSKIDHEVGDRAIASMASYARDLDVALSNSRGGFAMSPDHINSLSKSLLEVGYEANSPVAGAITKIDKMFRDKLPYKHLVRGRISNDDALRVHRVGLDVATSLLAPLRHMKIGKNEQKYIDYVSGEFYKILEEADTFINIVKGFDPAELPQRADDWHVKSAAEYRKPSGHVKKTQDHFKLVSIWEYFKDNAAFMKEWAKQRIS